jgi:hypothetical protein
MEEVPPNRRKTPWRYIPADSDLHSHRQSLSGNSRIRFAKSPSVSPASRIPVTLLTIAAGSIPDEVIGLCN